MTALNFNRKQVAQQFGLLATLPDLFANRHHWVSREPLTDRLSWMAKTAADAMISVL